MSGGSYNYLFTQGADQISDQTLFDGSSFGEMLARLKDTYPDAEATSDMEALRDKARAFLAEVEVDIEKLKDVWKAVEWCDSCDWDEREVVAAIATYELKEPE